MSQRKNSKKVTLVDRPMPFSKQEIEEAQNSLDELILDEPLDSPFISDEEAQKTLGKVEQALEKNADTEPVIEAVSSPSAEDELSPLDEIAPPPFPQYTEENMDSDLMVSSLESLVFISDKPLSLKKLRDLLGNQFSEGYLQTKIELLQSRYELAASGLSLVEVNGGYQLRTKLERSNVARRLARVQKHRLSKGAMETLAIITYRQPVMREEIDKVRGVDSSHFLRILLEKRLIEMSGRSELPGRPILYTTTPEFLEIFGIKDLQSLPALRELEAMVPASEVGEEPPELKVIRDMIHDMSSQTSEVNYNPKEDDVFLGEIRKRVQAIPTTTPELQVLDAPPPAVAVPEEQKITSDQ